MKKLSLILAIFLILSFVSCQTPEEYVEQAVDTGYMLILNRDKTDEYVEVNFADKDSDTVLKLTLPKY